MVKKVILDMDPGVDDALAIILALNSPEIEVLGITTVAGNVEIEKTTSNALKVVELLGKGIPVVPGFHRPLIRQLQTAAHFHGADGLGNSNLPEPKLKAHKGHAIDFLEKTVLNYPPRTIDLVATGPLTNVAVVLLKNPSLGKRLNKIVSMGGAFALTKYGHGNCSPVAEFNIYCDPEAAQIVYSTEAERIGVGLDVTTNPQNCLDRKLLRKIGENQTKTGKFVRRILRKWILSGETFHLHDPLAVALSIDNSLVCCEDYPVLVETSGELTRGQTIVDRTRRTGLALTSVCINVDAKRFLKLFMDRVAGQ